MKVLKLLGLVSLLSLCAYGSNQGKVLTENTCSQCHSLSIVYSQSGGHTFWEEIIHEMYKKGLPSLSKAQEETIINYLSIRTKAEERPQFRRRPLD